MTELHFNNDGTLLLNSEQLPENCIIVISKGKAKMQSLHEYGVVEIKTHQGLVKDIANTQKCQF